LVATVMLGLPCGHAAAAESPVHSHAPLELDSALGWDDLIDASLATHPRRSELAARESEAAAWAERGKSWLAAVPAFYMSYLSDRSLDDNGLREYEGGLELPLWHAGQRDAVQGVASTATAESAAVATALRLEIAGLLRAVLWDIEAFDNDAAAAREVLVVADDLLRAVERRNMRGDLPLADVLLARADRLEKQQAIVAFEAQLRDAERAYRSLTGLDRRPAVFAEQRSAREDLESSHPLVVLAVAAVERARANFELVDREARGTMTLRVGPNRQQDPFSDFYTDSLSLAVRVPIGGGSHGVTQRASATRLIADAEAQRGQLLRRLELDLHEAEHALSVLEDTLALAQQRRDLAVRQAQMAQSAFGQGEIELRELLRIQQAAQSAERDVRHFTIERQRTISALNQALGETP
jgi:cobalt-zinc-cadmium efflux system outer membrane protein